MHLALGNDRGAATYGQNRITFSFKIATASAPRTRLREAVNQLRTLSH